MPTKKSTPHVPKDTGERLNANELREAAILLCEAQGIDEDKQRQAVVNFVAEHTRRAWINGKEFGWKKAWNWKRQTSSKGRV